MEKEHPKLSPYGLQRKVTSRTSTLLTLGVASIVKLYGVHRLVDETAAVTATLLLSLLVTERLAAGVLQDFVRLLAKRAPCVDL